MGKTYGMALMFLSVFAGLILGFVLGSKNSESVSVVKPNQPVQYQDRGVIDSESLLVEFREVRGEMVATREVLHRDLEVLGNLFTTALAAQREDFAKFQQEISDLGKAQELQKPNHSPDPAVLAELVADDEKQEASRNIQHQLLSEQAIIAKYGWPDKVYSLDTGIRYAYKLPNGLEVGFWFIEGRVVEVFDR